MAVKIRLKRLGKIRVPQYRIVVVDARKKRDGKVIEEIGKYHPKEDPSYISVVSERAQYWLGVGAQPTDAVAKILKVTGDWQRHKGIAGAEGSLKTAATKRDKTEIFNEALKEATGEPRAEAATAPRKRAAKKSETQPAEEPAKGPAEEPTAEPTEPAGEPAADQTAVEPTTGETAEQTPLEEAAVRTPGVETPEGATEEADVQEAADSPKGNPAEAEN